MIIQADEGPYVGKDISRKEKIDVRTGIITAICIPGHFMADAPPSTITPVNTFRYVFNNVFDGNMELLKNRIYFSEHVKTGQGRHYGFVDVTLEIYSESLLSK